MLVNRPKKEEPVPEDLLKNSQGQALWGRCISIFMAGSAGLLVGLGDRSSVWKRRFAGLLFCTPHAYRPWTCLASRSKKDVRVSRRGIHGLMDGQLIYLKQGPGAFIYSTVGGGWLAGQGGDLYSGGVAVWRLQNGELASSWLSYRLAEGHSPPHFFKLSWGRCSSLSLEQSLAGD